MQGTRRLQAVLRGEGRGAGSQLGGVAVHGGGRCSADVWGSRTLRFRGRGVREGVATVGEGSAPYILAYSRDEIWSPSRSARKQRKPAPSPHLSLIFRHFGTPHGALLRPPSGPSASHARRIGSRP